LRPARTRRALEARSAAVATIATATAACTASSQRLADQRADVERDGAGRAEDRRTALTAGSTLNSSPATTAAPSVASTIPADELKS
jgi:hypothetical protein